MIDQFLLLELRVLILQHGRRKVLEALAILGEQTVDQVEQEIVGSEQRRKARTQRKPKSVAELIAATCKGRENIERPVSVLMTRYENRMFLPQLRNVERFLDRVGIRHGRLKSRVAAVPKIIEALSQLSEEELNGLYQDTASAEQTDFVLLAREIMGGQKPR